MKLTAKISCPNKDFTDSFSKDISVTIKEPNSDGDVLFEADMPTHVFDKLKNTSKGYTTKDKGGKFRKRVSTSNYKHTCELLQNYCDDALSIKELEELEKEKKLFIQFNFNDKKTRDNWCGAYTGKLISTQFRYFVGYKTSTKRGRIGNFSGELETCIRYVSMYYNSIGNKNWKHGKLQPLNQDWQHEEVEKKYKIIDWTEERENFLKEIEQRFGNLGDKLNEFLGDINGDKIDSLIESNFKLLE